MSTYTQIIYQIVFGTRNRIPSLDAAARPELYKYIHGIITNHQCHAYRINGFSDHIHILTHLHPSVALATLVKDIKLASSDYMKRSELFPLFQGWQEGYGAFTYSIREKDRLIHYLMNQENHHRLVTWQEEFREFLNDHGIEYDERYLP